MVMIPSRLKPLLRPITFVFTSMKFACSNCTAVCSWTCTGEGLIGALSKEVKGATAAQPLNTRQAAKNMTHLGMEYTLSSLTIGEIWRSVNCAINAHRQEQLVLETEVDSGQEAYAISLFIGFMNSSNTNPVPPVV